MNQIGKQRGENKNRNGYPTINPAIQKFKINKELREPGTKMIINTWTICREMK